MNRDYIIAENRAYEEIEALGHKPQGITTDKKVATYLSNGKLVEYSDWQETLRNIKEMK